MEKENNGLGLFGVVNRFNIEEVKKYCELSAYEGGYDALNGLTKKGRVKYFINNFTSLIVVKND